MTALFDHRLLVVTGKGGVGRTTCAAALALAAGRAGRRACVVEIGGQDALAGLFGYEEAQYEPRTVAPGVDLRSLSVPACLGDFGSRKLRLPGLARWFFESRLMTGFVDAVPGLHDLVQLGKIENMLLEPLPGEPVYDLVVLDAPATGHGLTLLASARAMREMTGGGPFHELAAIIERLLEDRVRTGVVVVTLPEALPVQEGLELVEALAAEDTPPVAALVNQVGAAWPDDVPADVILAALAGDDPARIALRRLAEREIGRHGRERSALTDLALGLPAAAGRRVPIVPLPRVEDPRDLEPLVAALLARATEPTP